MHLCVSHDIKTAANTSAQSELERHINIVAESLVLQELPLSASYHGTSAAKHAGKSKMHK